MIYTPTAIVLFSRTPNAEAAAKPLTGDESTDILLFSRLYDHTYSIAKHSGLPVIIYDEQKQQGNSFGEKIETALEETFAAGYENIIVIGNDCIQLTEQCIRNTLRQLQAGKQLVAGPDKRGGLYLFGINKAAFSGKEIRAFSWQTPRLFREFKKYSDRYTSFFLCSKSDINHSGDLLKSASYFSPNALWRSLLRRLIHRRRTIYQFPANLYHYIRCYADIPLRAPPCS